MKSGFDVSVLEARMRPGGRICTLRDPFADGLYAEAGAMDFGDGYKLLLAYIQEFNLPVVEVPFAQKNVAYVRGKRFVVPSDQEPEWPLNLNTEERRLGRLGLWQKYIAPAVEEVGDPLSSHWPSQSALQYDSATVDAFLSQRGLSKDAVTLCNLGIDGQDYNHVSALQSLAIEGFYSRSKSVLTLRGGNDQLPRAFAAKLGNRIRYGAELKSISQNRGQCSVTFRAGGRQQQLESDHIICTIPFSVLRHLELPSTISDAKRDVISKMKYENVLRVYLQFRQRLWSQEGVAGNVFSTDLPIGLVIDHTSTQAGSRGILEGQMEAVSAKNAEAMSDDQRLSWALAQIEKVHPGLGDYFEGGTSFCWSTEPWSLGAWAYYEPGEMKAMFPHVSKPEGRIHFAGEHTSPLGVTLEGAVESGRRTAQEVLAS